MANNNGHNNVRAITFEDLVSLLQGAAQQAAADPAEELADASMEFFTRVAAAGGDGIQSLQVVQTPEGEDQLWACYATRLPLDTADVIADTLTSSEDRKKTMLQILTSAYAMDTLLRQVFPGVGEKTFTFDNRRTP